MSPGKFQPAVFSARMGLPIALVVLVAAVGFPGKILGLQPPRKPNLESRIDPGHFDAALLASAIFSETNRVRRQHRLSTCAASERADAAATLQASLGAARHTLSHENPNRGLDTVLDRAIAAGLAPVSVAENLAVESAFDVRGATRFTVRRPLLAGAGETVPPGPPHTYESLAQSVVNRWLRSPGHRANLLDPRWTLLGCAAAAARGISGTALVYCAQVFVEESPPPAW